MAAVGTGTSTGAGRVPLIAGNWKLNLDHLQAIAFVQKLAWTLQDKRHDFGETEVAVFPPFTDLRSVQTLVSSDDLRIGYGGQDVSEHDSGAFTGEISGAFLAALDCRYALIGHSERRQYHHETDEQIAAKVAAAHRHGLVPVICVGETAEDLEVHGASKVPADQLRIALGGALGAGSTTGTSGTHEVVVAYEPVWAIGSGTAATSDQAQQVCAVLRQVVAEVLGEEAAAATRILYGGSVTAANIAGFMKEPDVDGALVGGASLKLEEFASIVRFKAHVGTA